MLIKKKWKWNGIIWLATFELLPIDSPQIESRMENFRNFYKNIENIVKIISGIWWKLFDPVSRIESHIFLVTKNYFYLVGSSKLPTSVVRFLHLSLAANMFNWVDPGGRGHWSMSSLRRSISIPLVPLKRMIKELRFVREKRIFNNF